MSKLTFASGDTESSISGMSVRTLRVRVKDRHAKELSAMARSVNFVWNYINELSYKVLRREGRFISNFELDKFTAGATKEGLGLSSNTVQAISKEFATRRNQFKKPKLRWRASAGNRRALGWIPLKGVQIAYKAGQLRVSGFRGPISLWDSYGLSGYVLGAGSFSEDSRGRWYFNSTVKVAAKRPLSSSAIGIDLGLKSFAATSAGEVFEARRFYREIEPQLAVAQRANKKDRMRALHAKAANRRKDFLHKLSARLVAEHGAIFVGNVKSTSLVKTKMAKSVLDSGWSMFRTMLMYKSNDAGAWFEEVDEAYSTQDCSACHARSGPKGLKDLGIREWKCSCGASHDRDVNAAKNILAVGLGRLAVGILASKCEEEANSKISVKAK